MSDLPQQFVDLPVEWFPFTVQFLHPDTLTVLKEISVKEPGVIIVPSADSLGVKSVEITITYGDGGVVHSYDT